MTVKPLADQTKGHLDRDGIKGLVREAARLVIQGLIIFLCAGRMDWLRGWIYLGLALSVQTLTIVFLALKDPQLINRRARVQKGTKGFDLLLLSLIFPLSYLALAVSSLDGGRYGWSEPGLLSLYSAGAAFVLGGALLAWAMGVNTHFEATIRIQEDQGHQVCASGPYAQVRHPGYLGWLLVLLSTPLILGSWWGLIPAGLASGLIVVRTALEDRTLKLELDGYKDYSLKVKYRLLPFLW